MKKYKLLPENKIEIYEKTLYQIQAYEKTLYQIQAIVSFGSVLDGELGGYIETEKNLSQENNAWVYDGAWVSGDAWVYGDARVSGNARVSGDARVYGKLKLLAGFFFGVRYKKEEIKFEKIDDDDDLIYKGEAKFGEN